MDAIVVTDEDAGTDGMTLVPSRRSGVGLAANVEMRAWPPGDCAHRGRATMHAGPAPRGPFARQTN